MASSIDDDNAPAPENIPTGTVVDNIFGEWGHNGICERKRVDAEDTKARMKGIFSHEPSIVSLFLYCFSLSYLMDEILFNTNKQLSPPLLLGEFLGWLGLWFLMATFQFGSRPHFLAQAEPEVFDGARIRLHQFMSRNQFEAILAALHFQTIPLETMRYLIVFVIL